MNVAEGRDASEDEELSVDASRWSVSMLQTSRVRYVLYVSNYYVRDEKNS